MATLSGNGATPLSFAHGFLSRAWWALLLRGLLSIGFGVLVFVLPKETLLGLIFVYGAFAIIDGLFSIGGAFSGDASGRLMLIVTGLISLAAGAAAIAWPGLTAVALVWIIAFWSVLRGLAEIVMAVRLRKEIDNEWLLIIAGAVSVLFGAALFASPSMGASVIMWLIGAWSILLGLLLVFLALKLKGLFGRR